MDANHNFNPRTAWAKKLVHNIFSINLCRCVCLYSCLFSGNTGNTIVVGEHNHQGNVNFGISDISSTRPEAVFMAYQCLPTG